MVCSIHVPGTSVAYCIDYTYFNIQTVSNDTVPSRYLAGADPERVV